MWKKSLFSSYKKVENGEEDVKKHTFNYQKLSESKEAPKQRRSVSHTPSSQQTFFVPPVFPVVPQRFVFFG